MSLAPPTTSNYRDLSDAISPSWLSGPIATAFRHTMAILFDALGDSTGYAIRFRFPHDAPPDAMTWLSADRQIDQGLAETDASFVERLIQWLDLHRYRGNSTGVLLAMLAVVLPNEILVRTVSNSGDWRTYGPGADPMPPGATVPVPPTQVVASPNNWDWDAAADPWYGGDGWWRMWIVLYPGPGLLPVPTRAWGDGSKYGDGGAYNWAGSQNLKNAWQVAAKKWKAGNCFIPYILVAYDSSLFDPSQPGGSSTLPDGSYGHWGADVGGVWVPSRMSGVAYLGGAA